MPYKDKEAHKKSARDSARRIRQGSTKGVNIIEGSTPKTGVNAVIPEGVNMYRYIEGKREELKEVPEGCKVLSDGQL